ncbi:hypothetical protein Tco_1212251 [Tanacetum coccineum]
MSAKDKNGLGYGTQLDEMSNKSETDSEISMSVFEVRSSDEEITPANDSETVGKTNEVNIEKPKSAHESVVPKPKINRDKVIIEDWYSDDEDDVSEVNTKERTRIKKIRACFISKSTDHLIKDCDFYAKKSPEPKLKTVVNTGQRVVKPVWDNANRTGLVNPVRTNGKRAVHTVSTARPISTARPVSTARPFAPKIAQNGSAIRPTYLRMDNVRPRAYSPIKRSYYTKPTFRPKNLKQDVKTFGVKNMTTAGIRAVVNTGKGKMNNDLKSQGKFGAARQIWCCQANLVLSGKFDAVRQIWCCQANLVLPGKISMANLEFVDQHNMVACLEKTEGNSDFHEIVDFLASSSIHHALTVSPPIYTSYIEQFWNTASSQTVNDVKQINATVDSKAVVVTEASIRSSLLFNDADGTACLTNEAIFQNLALMGYEGDFNKLTFQKALFSPQWKFLIHTILHCLSSKSTSWNEFSTNIASAVICLATNQKFNFSKLIFDGMLRNLDNTKKKFLMYPRFLMVFLNNQIELGEPFNDVYPTPAHNLKVFTNMSRKGLKFSGKITPLFPNMLTHAAEGEGSGEPTEPQPTPSPTQPSTGDQPPETSSSHATTQDSRDSLEGTNGNEGDQVQTPHDSPLSGGHTSDRAEGALNLQELSVLCTNLSNRVLALESIKDAQAAEISALKSRIKKLEKKCKPSISHHRAWLKSVKRLSMKKRFGKDIVFDDQDVDYGMEYMETKEAVDEGRQSGKTNKLNKSIGDKGGSTKELVSTVVPKTVSTSRPELSTARPNVDASRQEDSVVKPRTPPTTTIIFEDEDITMDQTLIKMKEEKSKEKGVSIKDVEDSSRPTRSTLTLKPLPTIDPKDKGKSVLEEPEPAKKMTRSDFDAAEIARDAEIARQLQVDLQAKVERERQREKEASKAAIAEMYDEVQAGIDADALFAAKL